MYCECGKECMVNMEVCDECYRAHCEEVYKIEDFMIDSDDFTARECCMCGALVSDRDFNEPSGMCTSCFMEDGCWADD
jgi:hypothetical protein